MGGARPPVRTERLAKRRARADRAGPLVVDKVGQRVIHGLGEWKAERVDVDAVVAVHATPQQTGGDRLRQWDDACRLDDRGGLLAVSDGPRAAAVLIRP